ncbi:39S ribosomal protein L33, mitochondrial isoform X1 [Monodon monoceros]|nr:39S ribosomal protein L33, mitochondrial isoform X1 [Monodon monoceros]
MFLSAVTFAKTKSKTILVKMLSQAGTGFSFNTKRSRLREKLTLLHYDPVEKAESQSRVILKELPCNNRDGSGEQEWPTQESSSCNGNHLGDLQCSPGSSAPEDTIAAS